MTPTPSCSRCRYMSVYANCGQPVAAGLAPRFMLVRHPDAGRGCPAFLPHRAPLEARAERMLKVGLIGLDDLDHVRMLIATQRGDDAAALLDLVERAEEKRR